MLSFRERTLGRPIEIKRSLRQEWADEPKGELKGFFVEGHQAQDGETISGTVRPSLILPNASRQITGSEPHKRSHQGKYLEGGPFYTASMRLLPNSIGKTGPVFYHSGSLKRYNFSDCTIMIPRSLWYNDFITQGFRSEDTSDLDPAGATAISRCSPVNPVDELGVGISESYREGLPSLPGIRSWESRTAILKKAGDEFLNLVFGWKPLIGEVKDFASTASSSRDLLLQYHRNQGSSVRRSFQFPISRSEHTDIIATNTKAEVGDGWSGVGPNASSIGTVSRTVIRTKRQWFSGAFTYAVPSQTDSWRRMLGYGSDADHLFGIALTPDLLWNLAPWSWAVDWFSNAGDVINNISNFAGAGQVMSYGFMMEEISTRVIYSMDRSSVFVGEFEIPCPDLIFEYKSKVRRQANPYGFGVSLSDLSPLQIAIAAAVGISLL